VLDEVNSMVKIEDIVECIGKGVRDN